VSAGWAVPACVHGSFTKRMYDASFIDWGARHMKRCRQSPNSFPRGGAPPAHFTSRRCHSRFSARSLRLFFPGEDELLIEGVDTSPQQVLPRLVSGRLRFVVFKRGADGGILYDAHHERFHCWDARVDSLVDQTGAGDAFAIGLVLAQLEGRPIEVSLHRAVVTASFALAGWGPDAMFAVTRADAEARLRQWYGEDPQ
jgi:hypothetical protein